MGVIRDGRLHGMFGLTNVYRHTRILAVCARMFVAVALVYGAFVGSASAEPSRDEAFRNDDLKIFVYKDGADPDIFWYLPPLRWLEENGRLVWYKRPRDGRMDYYFYVTPYMTPELLDYIASEIPNVRSQSQLRPVQLKRLGIRIPQFDVSVIGGDATDFQYLNTPQLIRLTLELSRAEDFEFFLSNPPGIMANVFFFYTAERVDRYINLELSCHDVYNAMRVGVAGKYEFLQGEIEERVFEYIANRHLHIRSKGDIPLPDIINRAIGECFTPIQPPRVSASIERILQQGGSDARATYAQQNARWFSVLYDDYVPPPASGLRPTLPGTPGVPGVVPTPGPIVPGPGPIVPPGPGPGPGPGPTPPRPFPPTAGNGLMFQFRRDSAEVTRNFYFSREQVSNSEEVTAIPIMMSLTPAAPPSDVDTRPYPQRDFLIENAHGEQSPLSTGIQVRRGDQFLITSVFALLADSSYSSTPRRQLRWDSQWPSPNEDLYYRVGRGPWVPVNGRAVIASDSLVSGELQFYMNRSRIWEKLPADLRERSGLFPPVLRYRTTYPQFNISITGRHTGEGR